MHNGKNDYEIDAENTVPFPRPLAHSFVCFALLASIVRFAALISLLARSLTRFRANAQVAHLYELSASISLRFNPLLTAITHTERLEEER